SASGVGTNGTTLRSSTSSSPSSPSASSASRSSRRWCSSPGASPMHRYVNIEAVGKTFETKKSPFVALTGIDLQLRKGEFVTLIGHSGCGKSTLLNLVAGLLKPTEGTILLAERHVDG